MASSKLAINRRRQEGNPLLKYTRNVPFEWADIKVLFAHIQRFKFYRKDTSSYPVSFITHSHHPRLLPLARICHGIIQKAFLVSLHEKPSFSFFVASRWTGSLFVTSFKSFFQSLFLKKGSSFLTFRRKPTYSSDLPFFRQHKRSVFFSRGSCLEVNTTEKSYR